MEDKDVVELKFLGILSNMPDLSSAPKFLVHEQQYQLPEDANLSVFYVTEIIPNPSAKKAPVPADLVIEMMETMSEADGSHLRYSVLYNPIANEREEPLTAGWDAFSQPLQPNLSSIRKKWHPAFMVIMTFEPVAQPISNLLGGQVVSPHHL